MPLEKVSNSSMSASEIEKIATSLKPSGSPDFLIDKGTGLIEAMLEYSLLLFPVDLTTDNMAHTPKMFFSSKPRSSSGVNSRLRHVERSLRSVDFSANDSVNFLEIDIGSPLFVTRGWPLSSSLWISN